MVLIHCLLSFIGCSLWMFNSIPASKISRIIVDRVYEQSVAPRLWRSWGYANRPSIVLLLLCIRVFVSNNNNVCVASRFNVSWANPCIYDRSLTQYLPVWQLSFFCTALCLQGTYEKIYVHLIPKWPPFSCSFVNLQINPCCLGLKFEIQENISF